MRSIFEALTITDARHAPRADNARSDRQLLAWALVGLPLSWLALRVVGLRRCLAWLDRSVAGATPATFDASAALRRAVQVGMLVNVAAGYAPGPVTCLSRSLLLAWLLGREGIATELRIGVRIDGNALVAHAWVETGGVPINDDPDVVRNYTPFAERMSAPGRPGRAYRSARHDGDPLSQGRSR